ncbi:carboxypeptidase M32, partial [candidate division GN15 bacterium]|nr:carboxypeptidase M32 [candidate division GN15 bacterium]
MTAKDAYQQLVRHFQETSTLESVNSVLEWDQDTYMPRHGVDHRAEQMSLVARMVHERETDPKINDWLAACEESELVKDPLSVEAVNVREWRYDYDLRTKMPVELVEEITRTTTKARQVWIEARKKRDFAMFAPWLEKNIELNLRKADALGYEDDRYDALLDGFEPHMKTAEVETVFTALRPELVELVARIKDAPRRPDIGIIKQPYDVTKQALFAEMVAQRIGYDFASGRLDITTHPFCAGLGPDDTRICTRWYPEDWAEGLTGTTHETGHALYDMGLDRTHYGTPMGDAISSGIHESQSRLWENQVGRSRGFWEYFFPVAQGVFREQLGNVSLDDIYGAMNYVTPSYIRVEADEATYNLHIMLRFELERALVSGELKAKDVAGEWNKRFKEYLGIEVDHDANGCLQDVHWSAGYMGYFPTYALGNVYAAQFYAKANEDMPGLQSDFAQGEFTRLLGWLREKIHRQGRRYRAVDLVKEVTGQELSHRPLIDYLYA